METVEIYKSAVKQLQQVVSQTPQRIKKLHELIQRADWEEQDILHLVELESFNAFQGYDIAAKLQKVRRKRREYKDELEALIELRKAINNNSKLENHVSTLSKVIDDDKKKKEKRKYNVRVRTDLAKRFERIHAKEGKFQ